jgi:hypothetical protein
MLGDPSSFKGRGILIDEVVDRSLGHVQDRHRIETEEDRQDDHRDQDDLFAQIQIEDRLQAFLVQRAEDDPAVEIERITADRITPDVANTRPRC